MVSIKTFISVNKPAVQSGLWLKPIEGGFSAYLIEGSTTMPLKIVEGGNSNSDDVAKILIGSVKDKKSANTINGAKAYANDVRKTVVGSSSDTSADMTLNGLKTYINEKLGISGK